MPGNLVPGSCTLWRSAFSDQVVESRGEVALLTRSILIRGNMNEEFVEVLPACEEEFDSGAAFSDGMQTCFAGKFGEELGSDEMGAIIIVSPKYKDQGLVAARIEYVEFTNVGQAFRVGRYPIHFHLPGNMSTSYIRGNAVHHSNNRACTLHDVSNLVVEHNVAYNVKGLSFFLEDGVEEYNTCSTTWLSSQECQILCSILTSTLPVSGLSIPTTSSGTTPVQVELTSASG